MSVVVLEITVRGISRNIGRMNRFGADGRSSPNEIKPHEPFQEATGARKLTQRRVNHVWTTRLWRVHRTMSTPQLLPLHLDHDGPAPVDTYFHVTKDSNGTQTAAFRGRAMYGLNLALPEGYSGAVFSTKTNKNGDKQLELSSKFSEFTLWRADVPVDVKSDEYARAVDEWTRMATLVRYPFIPS